MQFELAIVTVFLAVFLLLRPRDKILVSFFLISSCFNLAPDIVYGYYVRDAGFILLGVTWVDLSFRSEREPPPPSSVTRAVALFTTWCFVCLAYGLIVYKYPVILTLKAARQLTLGYCTYFVFRRLFSVDPGALRYLLRVFYFSTYLLMPVYVLQYLLNKQLLFGLVREYAGAVRALPIILPLLHLFLWRSVSRGFAAEKWALHEAVYTGLAVSVIAITFTRGIYAGTLLGLILVAAALSLSGKLRVGRVAAFSGAAAVVLCLLIGLAGMDRVIGRFSSGVNVVTGSSSAPVKVEDDLDTFSGRLLTAADRVRLVAKQNPFIGYGFIHETIVPDALRNDLKHGSIVDTPSYNQLYAIGYPYVLALHSADIGWVDVVVDTGLVGLFLILSVVGAVVVRVTNIMRTTFLPTASYYAVLAFGVEIIVQTILMFNGNPLVGGTQFFTFCLSGFVTSAGYFSARHSIGSQLPASEPVIHAPGRPRIENLLP